MISLPYAHNQGSDHMLTAAEARAYAYLKTPKEFSIHKHIEIRIWDAI